MARADLTADSLPASPVRAGVRVREAHPFITRRIVEDMVLLGCCAVVAGAGVMTGWFNLGYRLGFASYGKMIFFTPLLVAGLFFLLRLFGRSEPAQIRDMKAQLLADLRVFGALFAAFLAAIYATKTADLFPRGWILGWVILGVIGLFGARLTVARLLLPKLQGVMRTRLLLVGTRDRLQEVERFVETRPLASVSTVGSVVVEPPGSTADVAERVAAAYAEFRPDEVVIALPLERAQEAQRIVEQVLPLPVDIALWLDRAGTRLAERSLYEGGELPRVVIVRRAIRDWGRIAKGAFDRAMAALLLLVVAPLMLAIAVAIKIDSPGPVFFRQMRYGHGRKPFVMWKFRTMRHGCDRPGDPYRQASRNDDRVTRVGRLLRRASLDELPQLWNVLTGDMSLVGPRPHPVRMDETYGREVALYVARHRVKPGITGWAQINGYRGETDTPEKMQGRIEHDLYYIRNWSFAFDMWILLQTPFRGLINKNAY